jgi:hypothetical protein
MREAGSSVLSPLHACMLASQHQITPSRQLLIEWHLVLTLSSSLWAQRLKCRWHSVMLTGWLNGDEHRDTM